MSAAACSTWVSPHPNPRVRSAPGTHGGDRAAAAAPAHRGPRPSSSERKGLLPRCRASGPIGGPTGLVCAHRTGVCPHPPERPFGIRSPPPWPRRPKVAELSPGSYAWMMHPGTQRRSVTLWAHNSPHVQTIVGFPGLCSCPSHPRVPAGSLTHLGRTSSPICDFPLTLPKLR